ncbi:MAG: PEGA domain-containing protein [Leptospirales bacterium]|nr:PEGA domain-containing protein [Leptospirales bacterium]
MLRPIQMDGADNRLQGLANALEKDVFDVLTAKGLEILPESRLKLDAPVSRTCADACLVDLAARSRVSRILVPILQKKKDSENFLCYLYTVQDGRITENNVLVLYINLPEARRRTAIASVMVELFPELLRAAPVAREAPPQKDKADAGVIRLLSDPAGAEVFVDGVRVGVTPVDLNTNGKMQAVRIAMPEYEEVNFPIRAAAKSEIMFTLQRKDRNVRIANRFAEQIRDSSAPADKLYWGAFARSLVLPGWGQYSKGDSSGFWFGFGSIMLAGTAVYADNQARYFRHRYVATARESQVYLMSIYGANQQILTYATLNYLAVVPGSGSVSDLKNCTASTCTAAKQNHKIARSSAGLFVGLYLWNVFDALLADSKRSSVTFGGMPIISGNDRGAIFGARVSF